MNVSFLQELLTTVAEQGRGLLPRSLFGGPTAENTEALARALMSGRGEASGVAIARQLLDKLNTASREDRLAFFEYLASELQPDPKIVAEAAQNYLDAPDNETLRALQTATYSPRREFFRRLNLAPGATAEIVALREHLLADLRQNPNLEQVDRDLERMLTYWFNRGFLVLRRIDWQTPAAILEKIIAYEAVHEIQGWDDLRRRLNPGDRRCFAFFHPSLVDDPLIFVEVALTREIPSAIAPVLNQDQHDSEEAPTTAVFYSISNCQKGLRGISFGNFLLKQVIEELVRDVPSLKTFVTLSPVPRFASWLASLPSAALDDIGLNPEERKAVEDLISSPLLDNEQARDKEELETGVLSTAAYYFFNAKSSDGQPFDPVARFHLGNGAQLERINWLGDVSSKGMQQAHGLMVNYRYNLADIERNHEAYAHNGTIVASRNVKSLLRSNAKSKGRTGVPELLALPNVKSKTRKGRSEPAD